MDKNNMETKRSEDKTPKNNSKIIIIAAIVVIILVLVVIITSFNKPTPQEMTDNQRPSGQEQVNRPDLDLDGNLIPGDGLNLETEELTEAEVRLQEAKPEVVGANPVLDGVVLTHSGEITRNDGEILGIGAPQASGPVSQDSLSSSAIRIKASATGFTPSTFEVSPGEVVTIALESEDMVHTLVFDDPSLSAIAVDAAKGETRVITFNAPTQAGEYTFRCSVFRHDRRGEVGTMIVR